MSAGVDVLAVLDDTACVLAGPAADQLAEARAAVADAIRILDVVQSALDAPGHSPDGMTKAVAAKRIRAALARVGGAA